MINQDRLVQFFMDCVQIDSPTHHEGQFAKHLAGVLSEIGFSVRFDDAGEKLDSDTGNLIAKLPGNAAKNPLLFSCHMDTVSPGIGIKPHIEDGVIKSDGTTILASDDKAGISALIEAVKIAIENNIPHPPIEIAFSIFEEGGLHGAKNLDFSQFQSKKAFVLDSSGRPGQIVIQGPAQDKVNVTIKGRPAHAGVSPENGISAIMIAAEAISKMKLLRIDSETTANIGRIEGGGATNIVPADVSIFAEARSLNNEKLNAQSEHMKACFEDAAKQFGGEAHVTIERMYNAFSVASDAAIVKDVVRACEAIGIEPFTTQSGGGSDTNIYNAGGIEAVNLGIGAQKPHTLEEHIRVEDLVNASRMVLELIKG